MTRLSNPPAASGGFFVGRAILVNGENYRRSVAASREPTVTALQTLASSLALAAFVVGGLLVMVALSGCATSGLNTTYNTAPADVIGRQTPHTLP